MMKRFRGALGLAGVIALGVVFGGLTGGAVAQDRPVAVEIAPSPSVTRHTVMIDGKVYAYTATAGTMKLPGKDGVSRADIFFIAYTLDSAEGDPSRPLTFSFNGGPGSSSVWLHLGTLGPKRVDMGEEGLAATVPAALIENSWSWLDLTDMVFIDPVSTGYSRAEPGVSPKDFHGLDEDIQSVGEFIRLYVTREQRWNSPKFLIGESYGTTRAAGLASHLQSQYGMELNGISLVSPVLDFGTIRFDIGNDQPFWLYLPTYAATAFYHGKLDAQLSRDLRATLDEVEAWAETEYLVALAKGDRLSAGERARVAKRLASYTGLSERFVLDSDLRIDIMSFTKELTRDEGRTVGRLDSRFKGIDRLAAGQRFEYDPSYTGIFGPYAQCLNAYVREDLGYVNDLPYEILTGDVRPWSYRRNENSYVNVAERLRGAMSRNPALHVWVSCGYYDLATPHFAAEYTVSHMQLDPSLRQNVMVTHYEAGHMMYLKVSELKALKRDAVVFYGKALGR